MPGQGVYRSSDGGESWQLVNSGLGANKVLCFLMSDANGVGRIFAGTEGNGVFVLNQNTWTSLDLPGQGVQPVELD